MCESKQRAGFQTTLSFQLCLEDFENPRVRVEDEMHNRNAGGALVLDATNEHLRVLCRICCMCYTKRL